MRQTQNRPGFPKPGAVLRVSAELIAVAVLAVVLARAVWFVAYGGDAGRLDLDLAGAQAAPSAQQAGTDLSVLGRARLFAAREFADVSGLESAPETRLALTLHGVRRGSDPQSGSAIIESREAGQRTLPVGAEIAPDVTLEAIYPDRVIIDRQGVRESLYLREEGRRASLLQPSGAASEAVGAAPAPAPEPAPGLSQAGWVRGLRLERAEQGGTITGYAVLATSDPALLRAAGLEPGDIITSVNGRRLDRSVNTLEVLEELAESASASFTVLRAGEARTIEVNLR